MGHGDIVYHRIACPAHQFRQIGIYPFSWTPGCILRTRHIELLRRIGQCSCHIHKHLGAVRHDDKGRFACAGIDEMDVQTALLPCRKWTADSMDILDIQHISRIRRGLLT